MKMILDALLASLSCLWLCAAACAQKTDDDSKPVADKPDVAAGLDIAEISGSLTQFNNSGVQVKTKDGQVWFCRIGPKTTVNYVGEANPAFLRPGLQVRFKATFDGRGMPQAEVAEVEIFRPSRRDRVLVAPGVFLAAEVERARDNDNRRGRAQPKQIQSRQAQPQQTRSGRQDQATQARVQQNRRNQGRIKQGKPNQDAPAQGATQEYWVVGQLRGMQQGRIQVIARPRTVMVQLAQDAKFPVTASDLTFCVSGDEVTVTGLKPADQKGYIEAEAVEVVGAKELGEQFKPQNPRGHGRDKPSQTQDKASRIRATATQQKVSGLYARRDLVLRDLKR